MDPQIFMANLGYVANIFDAIVIAMGLGLFMSGLFRLKRYGEMRTFMSYQMTLAWPMLMMVGGILLLAFPFTISTVMVNIWGTSNPLRYTGPDEGFEQLIPPILVFIRLIGIGSFIRGVLLFSRTGREGVPPGTMGKAMLHMLGGLLCVHILGSWRLFQQIIGWSTT